MRRIVERYRDVNSLIKSLVYFSAKPKEVRPGFLSSFNASYTVNEIHELLRQSELKDAAVTKEFFGLCISGKKTV